VHLIDFGSASRLVQDPPGAPASLSLAYMSPEQTGRMNRVIDHRTDFYSLGVTLYELVTGVLPFAATDPVELVFSHLARQPLPPHEVVPSIPVPLSELVMKLLCKAAEDRYQSAHGIRADLETCLEQLQQRGTIAPFPLARHDHSTELHLSQKLYGRQRQVAALASAVQRARAGAAELFLVLGQGGAGKSALVHEVHTSAVPLHQGPQGALFATGRCAPHRRASPHVSLAEALRELCQQILTTGREECASWREALAAAVGSSGRLLTDLIPELEILLGPQPPLPQLGAPESQNRFNLIFQKFVQVFTTRARPLVLFLDDAQWADTATLNLLRRLLTDPSTDGARGHLLLIVAYRDNEVGPGHPLSALLAELRRADVRIHEAYLPALTVPDLAELLRDSLGSEAARCTELANVLYDKTHGNPFFINQFLRSLRQEGLLHFDYAVASWQWSLADIKSRPVTSNVVEFMAAKIRLQPQRTQRALMLAACIGYQFELSTLSALCGLPPLETAEALWPALREGLCLPLDGEYRFAHLAGPLAGQLETHGGGRELELQTSYRFLHDRVRQAAGSLLSPGELPGVHLHLARHLRAHGAAAADDHGLLDVVNHYNRGCRDLTDEIERREVARLNLAAGQRAKATTAFVEASAYLQAGVALLPADRFAVDYALSFSLYIELAECSYLSGQLDRAEQLFEILLPQLRSDIDRARVATLRVELYATRGRPAQALAVGIEALERLGVVFPRAADEQHAAVSLAVAEFKRLLAGRTCGELLELPASDSDELLALQRLLLTTCSPALLLSPSLLSLLSLKLATTSLLHGHTSLTAYGYVSYAVIAANVLGSYEEAHAFAQLALELDRRIGGGALTCKLRCLTAGFVNLYVQPLRHSLTALRAGISAGLEAGDFTYVGFTCHHIGMLLLGTGEELGAVRHELERLWALARRTREQFVLGALTVSRQAVLNLCGQTHGRGSLSSPGFDEEPFVAGLVAGELAALALWYFTVKLQLGLLYGDYAAAARAAAEAHCRARSALGQHCVTDLFFFTALVQLRRPASLDTADLPSLEALCERLDHWAQGCPESYRHKALLIAAERARLRGQNLEALALYDQSIALATQGEFVHHLALANELCARSLFEQKRPRLAHAYLQEAAYAYQRWGATAKLAQLREEFPALFGNPHAVASATPAGTTSLRVSVLRAGALDVTTLVHAAQSIASEIVLERLLAELLRSVATSAGAQRGVLFLDREGRLLREGAIALDPDHIEVGQARPLEQCTDVARSIVQLVAHTREAVVLGSASRDPRFASDPYIQAHRPRSLLCLALKHRGRVSGVVYLENNTAEDVFTADRIELLRLLSGQAAIALENASLYTRVHEITDKLTRISEELLHANAELLRGSEDLRRANEELVLRTEDLRTANERTQRELAERVRIEHERAMLQEEVIRMQGARLAELAAPLIPLSAEILVLPLIGSIDSERAQHVLRTLLEGVQSARARVVILDITGLKHIDAPVAGLLVQAASALRLLGTQAVLTGLRAEVARTLVSLGIDLGALVTRGTLQSGIAFAQDAIGRLRAGPLAPSAPVRGR
jgi:anti-anti-sigma factor